MGVFKSLTLTKIVKVIFTALLLCASLFMLAMTAFFFDAPGSEKNSINYFLVIFVTSFPASFIPLLWSKKYWLVPLISSSLMLAAFAALEYFCNGMFACQKIA